MFLCLALLGLKVPDHLFAKKFCSQRYHYCLDFPSSMFPYQYQAPGEDSLLFATGDSLGLLSVISTPFHTKLDSHLAFEQRMRTLTAPGGEANILSIINGDDYYEVNFLYDGHWYHQKAGFFSDCDVLYTIKVPVNRPDLMVRMKADVGIEFL